MSNYVDANATFGKQSPKSKRNTEKAPSSIEHIKLKGQDQETAMRELLAKKKFEEQVKLITDVVMKNMQI